MGHMTLFDAEFKSRKLYKQGSIWNLNNGCIMHNFYVFSAALTEQEALENGLATLRKWKKDHELMNE
jgi:hypothetical protein